jgi:hypothetical protein
LLFSYPSIFSYTGENNKEVIFDVQYMASNNGATYPSMLTPSGYWSGLGLSCSYNNGFGSVSYDISRNMLKSYTASAGDGVATRDTFSIQHKYNTSPTIFIVLRYTDVLLMKAECILHGATGTQTYVDSVVNLVREGLAVTTMNTWIANDSIAAINKVIWQFVVYPVPNAELLMKPGLYTQNDGY